MCIACEMALLMALDELPDEPPPGFPRPHRDEGFACDALVLFAYPLHPPGQPEKLRDEHLPKIRVPVLCFNGTRDPFCTRALMERAVAPCKAWDQRFVDHADHSFHVPKSSGTDDDAVMAAMADATVRFVRG